MAVAGLGLLGSISASTAGTTLVVPNSTGAIIPAGTLIHVTGCWDNINSVTAPTITSSTIGGATATANHATAVGSGVTTTAGSGVWHQCFRVLTTANIAVGATIATLTSNQSAVKRAAHAEGWSGATATPRGTVATATSTTGAPSVATAGTALVTGDLVIGSVSFENNAQMVADADTTNGSWPPIVGLATTGGGPATNVGSGSQFKIVTATGVQTFNPTGGGADTVACVYSLQPALGPNVGTGTGTFDFVGTAAGTKAPQGSTTGAFNLVGTGAGTRESIATGTGAFSFAGAAVGESGPKTSYRLLEGFTPPAIDATDAQFITVSMEFYVDTDGCTATKGYFPRADTNGTMTMKLWQVDSPTTGTVLATKTHPNDSGPTGWTAVTFDTPIPLTANQRYRISYTPSSNYYVATTLWWTGTGPGAAGIDDGPLHAPPSGTPGQGQYVYAANNFTTETFNGGNYWVDVEVSAPGGEESAEGSGTGTFTFNGAGTGARAPVGIGAGSFNFVGTGAGVRAPVGTSTGAFSFVGVAAGTRSPVATGTGTFDFTGAGAGARAPIGAGTGSFAFNGTAAGTRVSLGTGTGGFAFTGSAAGTRISQGSTAGALSYVGGAVGDGLNGGASYGLLTWTGTAAGTTTNSGTGTGSSSYSGAASGTAPTVGMNSGSAAGSFNFTGAGAGVRAPIATGVGTWTQVGVGVGSRTPVATGIGAFAFSGAASGSRISQGSATGALGYVGGAVGGVLNGGAGNGTLSYAGLSTGLTTRIGTGTGAWSFTGAATGVTNRQGAGTGSFGFSGTAAGVRTPVGTGTGSVNFTGAASGTAPIPGVHTGSGAGTSAFTGTASGIRFPVGAATGAFVWLSAAVGIRAARGTSTGNYAFGGSAHGVRDAVAPRTGAAVGTWSVTGVASGLNLIYRDLDIWFDAPTGRALRSLGLAGNVLDIEQLPTRSSVAIETAGGNLLLVGKPVAHSLQVSSSSWSAVGNASYRDLNIRFDAPTGYHLIVDSDVVDYLDVSSPHGRSALTIEGLDSSVSVGNPVGHVLSAYQQEQR